MRPSVLADTRTEIQCLDALLVAHPHLVEAHQALVDFIEVPAGRNILFLFGPTGVGKTTLVTRVWNILWETMGPTPERPGAFPAALISAPPATAHAPASLKWATQNALRHLREPGLDRKRILLPPPMSEPDRRLFDPRTPLPPDFHALVSALHERGTRALMIDESHQFSEGIAPGRIELQMEFFKLLADLSGALVVLIGTYAVLPQRNLNSQLGRRSDDIHFRRYRADIEEERTSFMGFLNSLQQDMAAQPDSLRVTAPCLVDEWELVYSRTVGCVGILKDWVLAAAARVLRRDDREIRPADLRATAPSLAKARQLYAETTAAEAELEKEEEGEDDLMVLLGLRDHDGAPAKAKPAKRLRRPGERKPKADPVGELADLSA